MRNLNCLASKHSAQKGFTLLELILVVFIMGTLAATSMSFIENEDGQWRYKQSLDKLDMVHAALVEVQDYNQQKLLSGFVYDNGV
ncbi:MAG: prepilin-type N-terminal cleavage/methylation domain-containing protein, partial [Bermanella sp.]